MKDSDGSKFESTDKILDSCKNYYQELTTNPAKDIEERVIEERNCKHDFQKHYQRRKERDKSTNISRGRGHP